MIIAVVQIPGLVRSESEAIASAEKSAPTYVGMPGLIRKYFLNGDAGGGGVYLWESLEQAKAWYTDEWAAMIQHRFGSAPVLTFYDNYVIVDNERSIVSVKGAST